MAITRSRTKEIDWSALVWEVHDDLLTLFYEKHNNQFDAHVSYARWVGPGVLHDLTEDTEVPYTAVEAGAEGEASFSMDDLERLTAEECDHFAPEVCEEAAATWRRLPAPARRALASGVRPAALLGSGGGV